MRHWLFLANVAMAIFTALPFLAPVLLAHGWTTPAALIYAAYKVTCHQMPTRSYFLEGYQMAFCQRNTAIYGSILLAGLVYAWRRGRIRPLSLGLYLLLCLPMAIDGGTQLLGLRESTWLLRTITGSLFGTASVWLLYPTVDRWHVHTLERWNVGTLRVQAFSTCQRANVRTITRSSRTRSLSRRACPRRSG